MLLNVRAKVLSRYDGVEKDNHFVLRRLKKSFENLKPSTRTITARFYFQFGMVSINSLPVVFKQGSKPMHILFSNRDFLFSMFAFPSKHRVTKPQEAMSCILHQSHIGRGFHLPVTTNN